ncbi:TetR/AcrR family transcriptional regulator [Streptomyces sp. 7-21]|uniref:TetR/AcrR family transcriptional regulator n=1 Tax=Streptomyces sp. 7-21 TaxID=2802283 RepID=UPI00191DBF00|nr:TetR/AcrR family transcriptional regulator [Streptomyces sp. 7-21]MBL1068153.1 TetR/AcrR family transcriptional regulator [Streptomyces sp. 7-21]
MPRTADHAARRAQIVEALIRVAVRDGLHAATMRSVAAEAGVSVRLVQYYFASKAKLLHAALDHLERRSTARWAARLDGLPDPPPPRAYVEAFLAEALPTDDFSRAFHLVWMSCAALAVTDPELAAQPFVAGPSRRERDLAGALARARDAGLLRGTALPPAEEAARLLALSHGLGTSVLAGLRDAESAWAVLRGHLDQLFAPAAQR